MFSEASIGINIHKENVKTLKQQKKPAHTLQSCIYNFFLKSQVLSADTQTVSSINQSLCEHLMYITYIFLYNMSPSPNAPSLSSLLH